MAEILSKEEIDALLSYEPLHEAHKGRHKSIQIVFSNFCKCFERSLSSQLRTNVKLKIGSINKLSFSEFLLKLSFPTSIGIFSINSSESYSIIELNPSFIYPVIDRFLGGSGQTSIPQREMTDIEMVIVDKVMKNALDDLAFAWQELDKIKFFLKEKLCNSQFMKYISLDEPVLVIVLDVNMGYISGSMKFCFKESIL